MLAKSDITSSNLGIFETFNMSNFENDMITSLMNSYSSLLFFVIVLLQVVMCSSTIGMIIVKGTWLDVRCNDLKLELRLHLGKDLRK